jgi:hypothetical protein
MHCRRHGLLLIAGLGFVSAAILAGPAIAQSRPAPAISNEAALIPVVGYAKEQLVQAFIGTKSADQVLSPAHHECPGNTPHVQPVACGSTTSDQLTTTGSCALTDGSFIDFYSFSGTAGQQVTITMAATFDTFLFLLDPTQTVAATGGEGGGPTDSQIVFTLNATGTWVIGANAYNASVVGAYTLTLQCGSVPACIQNSTTLCLNNGRFRVQAVFTTPTGQTGDATAVVETTDTGLFWFFTANNIEAIIKVVNACTFAAAPRYWVFAGGLTNVQVVLTVTDTQTGTIRTYTNPQGTAFAPIQDTNAFATCP